MSFDEPRMFVRGHNASNDSRQKPVKAVPVKPLTYEEAEKFCKRFAIDVDRVERIFGGS